MKTQYFPVIAFTIVLSLVFTVVSHACSDLKTMPVVVQTPCDHGAPVSNSPSNKRDHDCDDIRYGMLSISPSFPGLELLKLCSNTFQIVHVLATEFPLLGFGSSAYGAQAPPFSVSGFLSRISNVILRI